MSRHEYLDSITDMFITTVQWYEIEPTEQRKDKLDDIMDAAEHIDAWAEFCAMLDNKNYEIEKTLKGLKLWK